MTGKVHRVIQWSTGNIGRMSIEALLDRPDLELVGVIVHTPEKDGVDVGDLVGRPATGITCSTDVDEVLRRDADAVAYHALGDRRSWKAVADICRALEAGKDVVSTSVIPLVYPPSANPEMVAQVAEACRTGGATCFVSGIDPGFANDLLPLTLAGFCRRVDAVRVQEILNYASYDQGEVLFDMIGFGQPMEAEPSFLQPGVVDWGWRCVVQAMADGLGVELDDVQETHERWAADRRIETPLGVIEEGTIGAVRFELKGIVAGQPRIVVEHVTRMSEDGAPDWPRPEGDGSYRILVDGDPDIVCDLQIRDEARGLGQLGAMLGTAMRTVNAIPAVCAAPPGLLSALDLPLVTGAGAMPGWSGAGGPVADGADR